MQNLLRALVYGVILFIVALGLAFTVLDSIDLHQQLRGY